MRHRQKSGLSASTEKTQWCPVAGAIIPLMRQSLCVERMLIQTGARLWADMISTRNGYDINAHVDRYIAEGYEAESRQWRHTPLSEFFNHFDALWTAHEEGATQRITRRVSTDKMIALRKWAPKRRTGTRVSVWTILRDPAMISGVPSEPPISRHSRPVAAALLNNCAIFMPRLLSYWRCAGMFLVEQSSRRASSARPC